MKENIFDKKNKPFQPNRSRMLKIASTKEKVNSNGGLVFTGELFKRFELNSLGSFRDVNRRSDRINDSDICLAMMGLLAQGYTNFEDIELFRDDLMFQKSLELSSIPGASTLRTRLNDLGRDAACFTSLALGNLSFLKQVTAGKVNTGVRTLIPVDIDVSPFDNSNSKKEKVGRTYKGHDGYAPIFAYYGTEGYVLNAELRPGTQHCQKDAPEFIERCIAQLKVLNLLDSSLFRLDSGHDAAETLNALRGCNFIVKHNLRRESKEWWLEHARAVGKKYHPRKGKAIYTGTLEHLHPAGDENPPVTVAFRVTVRTSDAQGNPFLFEDISVDTWWTSLYEDAETIIKLYQDHGTSEQFHSEIKSDMNLERLPSGYFATNALILQLGIMVYNTLRCIDQMCLEERAIMPIRKRVKRRRVGSIIRDIIFTGCKLVSHAKEYVVKISESNPWLAVLLGLHRRLSNCC